MGACKGNKNAAKHGEGYFNNTTPEYRSWHSMKARCYTVSNVSYKDYGKRGLTVCDRWRDDYLQFLEDMGRKPSPSHSLDRINNDLGYSPSNCRWATKKEQANNRRAPKRREK